MQQSQHLKLSILVTAYNIAPYLSQCLKSILDQDVNFLYEILIADDCSTDNTAEIIKEYKEKHPDKIRAIYNPVNMGFAPNLCNLVSQVKGELFIQIDGDDFITETSKLQLQVNALNEQKDCAICFHNYTVIDADGNNPLDNIYPFSGNCVLPSNYLLHKNLGPGNLVMIRRNALPIILPEWLHACGTQVDYVMHCLAATEGKIYYIDKAMTAYRKHHQSITALSKRKTVLEMMAFNVERIATYYKIKGLKQEYIFFTSLLPRRFMVLGYYCLWQGEMLNFIKYFFKGFFMKPNFSPSSHKDMIYTASPDFAEKLKRFL